MGLSLARALRLERFPPRGAQSDADKLPFNSIAFVGAGGKTTALFQLARQLKPPVIVTTTTHLGAWQLTLADQHIVLEHPGDLEHLAPRGVTLMTGPAASDDRVQGLREPALSWLHDTANQHNWPLLIEADGARQKALKAPDEHEPAVPAFAEIVVVVAGLSGLGMALSDEVVHRARIFADLARIQPGDEITPEALARVLVNEQGGLRNIPRAAKRVALLNQADSESLRGQAYSISRPLLRVFDAVIIASLQAGEVHAVQEHVAGIVLAAGASQRLGRPKQLLDWRGQPFVRAVATTALEAGLSPVVVVTGASAQQVEAALSGLPVALVRNTTWQEGQASSIRAGLQAIPLSAGASIFLLADQPQVQPDVIKTLVDAHAAGLHPIVAPLVMEERRANPVLFDRDTFPELLALQGDVGGRAVFSKHPVEYVPWHDDRLLLDVDTEEDYRRLTEDKPL